MILLTLDTSAESESAVAMAADLAHRFQQPLHILLVVDGALRHHNAEAARAQGISPDQVAEAYVAGAVSSAAVAADGITVDGSFRHAVDAGQAIVEAAEDEAVSMVVMATHGRTGFRRFVAGSVTEHVVRNTTVPVMVVPVAAA